MRPEMLSSAVAAAADSLLREHRELTSRLVWKRARFENWLQLCILDSLQAQMPELDIERAYPNSSERCDFWMPTESRDEWLELKLCVTNYCSKFADDHKGRPITNQIGDILRDFEKLGRIDELNARSVLLIVYPLPNDYRTHSKWQLHLSKLRKIARLHEAFIIDLDRQGVACKLVGYHAEVGA